MLLLSPLITWMGIRQEQRIWTALKEHLEVAPAGPARSTDGRSTDGQSEGLRGQRRGVVPGVDGDHCLHQRKLGAGLQVQRPGVR